MIFPSQTYIIKQIKDINYFGKNYKCYTIEAFPYSAEEIVSPTFNLAFSSHNKNVSMRIGEIVYLDNRDFLYGKKGYLFPSVHFTKCKSEDIRTSHNLQLPIDRILKVGETSYAHKNVSYLKVRKFFRIKNTAFSNDIIIYFPEEKNKLNLLQGAGIDLDIKHLKQYKKDIYIADDKYVNCLFLSKYRQYEELTDQKVDKLKHTLPSHSSYQLSWKEVLFRNGNIVFRSPYAAKGGLGKIVKWLECKSEYEKIKVAFERLAPPISAHIENGNIININNLKELMDKIISLCRPRPKVLKAKIITSKEHIVKKDYPQQVSLQHIKKLAEEKESQYLKYLCKIHLTDQPIYYSTETKTTTSGEASPEKAFIFTIKEIDSKIIVIYENTIESRSSYVFVIKRHQYQNAIQCIHQFFASDKDNKREKMADYQVDFPKKYIYDYYRIIHNTFHQWKVDINSLL